MHKKHAKRGIRNMDEKKRYEVGAEVDSPATAAAGADTIATLQTAGDCDRVDATATTAVTATLQAKLQSLQAKLHKEFRWYCDTILQGGSLAVRVAYRVGVAAEVIQCVDGGEVRDDPALDEPMCYIGSSLYTESDIDTLLTVEYLLDDLYDAWCSMNHSNEEWSDTVDRCLDIMEGRYRYHNNK